MDVFDCLLNAGLVTVAIAVYLVFIRGPLPRKRGHYTLPGWNYPFKWVCARYAVRRWKKRRVDLVSKVVIARTPREDFTEGWETAAVRASAPDGTTLIVVLRRLAGRITFAEVNLHVQLSDGTTYELPRFRSCAEPWHSEGWSGGGLKLEVLDEWRMRVLFNGMLTRRAPAADGRQLVRHVRINLIWCAASQALRHPDDWSEELAARSLATETWRHGNWMGMITHWADGATRQWGSVQGRLQEYDAEGRVVNDTKVRARGVRENRWAPHGYRGLYRTVDVVCTARDGTAVHLFATSYKDTLTQAISGSVRLSSGEIKSISSADLNMIDFCERREGIPSDYTINVSAADRHFKLVLKIGHGEKATSGVPIQYEYIYRTLLGNINGVSAGGLLELGYEAAETREPNFIKRSPKLRWLSVEAASDIGYCMPFEEKNAACPQLVGGKCASLALLSKVQYGKGYKVPPGFCVTVKALARHLENHPELEQAIKKIESATVNYKEQDFKEKCNQAFELFSRTAIEGDLKDEILKQLKLLRKKVVDQNISTSEEMRFAVRSSAVGEDGEVLSAAGQNETVLGCSSDEDVLVALQKCWGSVFAFTSAHYRRQNGQACFCGAGVAVQALVRARAAGVLFTRHPDAGDPSRILITANYGLGESVVSGTIEPDTFIVNRDLTGELSISNVRLGSKNKLIVPGNAGDVVALDVPEEQRKAACLSDEEILNLARIGVAQEELWGAPRDIEWAVNDQGVYLLQARPITSLERWTEEELLHEMDWAVMSEEDMFTFANTGEVMPKPLTVLTQDVVISPLANGMNSLFGDETSKFESLLAVTHHRCVINMYNSVYRIVENEIDIVMRMTEFAVHGHTVADDRIHSIALQRRPPRRINNVLGILLMIRSLLWSKWYVKDSKRRVREFNIDEDSDLIKLMQTIKKANGILEKLCCNHAYTSTASSGSQVIAMTVLLEGAKEFSTEQCQELGKLLASGDAVSAGVPTALADLGRELIASGSLQEFRKQPPDQALQWLRFNLPHVHLDIVNFLENHGYRAVMEFDLSTKPWVLEPQRLMQVLQSMEVRPEERKVEKNNSLIVSSLVTPKKSSTKKILRWVIPLCGRMVANRESTKASLILAIHKLRLALRRVGNKMVQEWLLPDSELVFFFRLHELESYINDRDPALLRKAVQRRQYYPKWAQLEFPEIVEGWPAPRPRAAPPLSAAGARVQATPVCAGDVVARACVIRDLSEIGSLQQGDILITYCTDIGWSPYFPLLTGIVTELGGLISHGAVIAREYGLPCAVGASGATSVFRTGDLVRLFGTSGLVEKVEMASGPPNEQDVVKS